MANGPRLPGQVVLVLQGGGALGAYQAGVYEALHGAGIVSSPEICLPTGRTTPR